MAVFHSCGNSPIARDRFMMHVSNGRRTSMCSFNNLVGIGSRTQFVELDLATSLRTSSSVKGSKVSNTISTFSRTGICGGAVSSMLSRMADILSLKKVPKSLARISSESRGGSGLVRFLSQLLRVTTSVRNKSSEVRCPFLLESLDVRVPGSVN